MTQLKTTLGILATIAVAGTAQAQSDITRGTPELTAPSGDPFISVIVIDRATGGLKLCGSTQWDGDGPVTCGPMPAQAEDDGDSGTTPKQQMLWNL